MQKTTDRSNLYDGFGRELVYVAPSAHEQYNTTTIQYKEYKQHITIQYARYEHVQRIKNSRNHGQQIMNSHNHGQRIINSRNHGNGGSGLNRTPDERYQKESVV